MIVWIVIGSIIGLIIVVSIVFSLYDKAKGNLAKSRHKNELATALNNHDYQAFFSKFTSADFNDYPANKYLQILTEADFGLKDVFKYLISSKLLSVKSSFSISEGVPRVLLELSEREISRDNTSNCRVLKAAFDVIKTFYVSGSHPEYAEIDKAYDLLRQYLASKDVDETEDELSIRTEARCLLGFEAEYRGEYEKRAQKAEIDRMQRESNKAKASYQKEANALHERRLATNETLRQKSSELTAEKKKLEEEYELKFKELEQEKKKAKATGDIAERKVQQLEIEIDSLIETLKTNDGKAIYPFLAGAMADIETIKLKQLADALNWGADQVRMKKVDSLLSLRSEVSNQLIDARVSYYQLQYLLELFPSLQDILDAKYDEIKFDLKRFDYQDQDPTRYWLSAEEWRKLTPMQRNQLALDRYVESHSKNNWQIGRDYELYVGQQYLAKGYFVDFTGSYMGLEDMGRDLICKKGGYTTIIQCKFWGKDKQIHENHINQLYGTMVSYCIENNLDLKNVEGRFVTNISLSDTAKEFARRLGIKVDERVKMNEFPRIKCNIGVDEFGAKTKIYHLPMDLSYDSAKIDKPGEFFAFTVAEAEAKGFRRSYKWHGDAN